MRNVIIALTALTAACGIPGDTPLQDMTVDQWDLVCNHAVDTDAVDRIVTCGDVEVTVPASTIASCKEAGAALVSDTCAATFDDWVSCQEEPDYTDNQVCGVDPIVPSAACTAVVGCFVAPAM